MRILNLYAGIGGNRRSWEDVEVTAVENVDYIADVYAELFPEDTLAREDAHQYLLDHFTEFDFIWSSPPCPTHSRLNHSFMGENRKHLLKYPDMRLYQEIIFLKEFYKGKWVVENVEPYYVPLIQPTTMLDRHFYWSNFPISFTARQREGNLVHATVGSLGDNHGIELPEGTKDKRKLLRNAVDPRLGLHILKAAQKETKQETLL